MKHINLDKIEAMFKVISPSEKQRIKQNIINSISDSDITQIFGSVHSDDIIVYSDLQNYASIDELLPTDKSFKIILIRDQENSGHWTTIMRYKRDGKIIIEFFNSYGLFPSADLKFISESQNLELGQTTKFLNQLLMDALKKEYLVIYNKKAFQKYSTNEQTYNTCGRHVLFRLLTMAQHNFTLLEYIDYMNHLKETYNLNYDCLVSLII